MKSHHIQFKSDALCTFHIRWSVASVTCIVTLDTLSSRLILIVFPRVTVIQAFFLSEDRNRLFDQLEQCITTLCTGVRVRLALTTLLITLQAQLNKTQPDKIQCGTFQLCITHIVHNVSYRGN